MYSSLSRTRGQSGLRSIELTFNCDSGRQLWVGLKGVGWYRETVMFPIVLLIRMESRLTHEAGNQRSRSDLRQG